MFFVTGAVCTFYAEYRHTNALPVHSNISTCNQKNIYGEKIDKWKPSLVQKQQALCLHTVEEKAEHNYLYDLNDNYLDSTCNRGSPMFLTKNTRIKSSCHQKHQIVWSAICKVLVYVSCFFIFMVPVFMFSI